MGSKDEKYHLRCIELAQNGMFNVLPNPMVGALLVADDIIIGEGYHKMFGSPHAEVDAINSVTNPLLLSKSALYVNLEPCCHFGKTPPCVDLIIEKKIPKVVVGCRDPFHSVAGKGIEKLINAGIQVYFDDNFSKQSRFLNRRFFTFHENKRPFIILKWAETADGFIDFDRKEQGIQKPNWITDEQTRILVHKWRAEEQALLIGTNTAMNDNPKLNTREFSGKNPLRMILDKNLRLPHNLHIFDGSLPTIIFTEIAGVRKENIEFVEINFETVIENILAACYKRNIVSIIVEGGARLINSFIDLGLWDEARIFKGDLMYNQGIVAPKIFKLPTFQERLSNSTLSIYYNGEWESLSQ